MPHVSSKFKVKPAYGSAQHAQNGAGNLLTLMEMPLMLSPSTMIKNNPTVEPVNRLTKQAPPKR